MPGTTVVSAPGKVLIAGGYLVLDPAFSGTVVSTSSRFYTVIRDQEGLGANTIRVRSPQFLEATWTYKVSFDASKVAVEPSTTKYDPSRTIQCSIGTHPSPALVQHKQEQVCPPCLGKNTRSCD